MSPGAEATTHAPAGASIPVWRIWIATFFIAAALYALTANRAPQWQDSGWQQWRILTGTLAHSHGLALTHPLQFYLGRAALTLLPAIEPAFAITLVSSITAAVAIANLAATLLVLTRNRAAALISAAAMMLSHTFWQHATHTESYGIVLALLTAEWLCLARYCVTGRTGWLLGMALANGLGISNHMLAALSTPVLATIFAVLLHQRRIRAAVCAKALGVWLLGASLYVGYVIWTGVNHGSLPAAFHSAVFGDYERRVLNLHLSASMLGMTAAFIVYNFPGLTLPLALHAMVGKTDAPRLFWRAAWAWFVLYFVFAIRYAITDQYSFFFPAYAVLALFAGLGLADMATRAGYRAVLIAAALTAVSTPLVYYAAYKLASSRQMFAGMVGNKPYRDGWREFFLPWGVGQDCASRVNRETFDLCGPDGVIYVADSMMEHALRYHQRVHLGPQSPASLVDYILEHEQSPEQRRTRMELALGQGRRVVLVPYDRDRPDVGFTAPQWERRGDLYLLTGVN